MDGARKTIKDKTIPTVIWVLSLAVAAFMASPSLRDRPQEPPSMRKFPESRLEQ